MFMLNIYCVFAMFVSSVRLSECSIKQDEISAVLIRTWKELNIQCLLIGRLDSAGQGLHDMRVLKEVLHKVGKFLPSQVVELDSFSRTCNTQLNVFLAPSNQTNAALKKLVKRGGGFGRPRWLLFNNDHIPLEEIFDGVDLPFNSQLIIGEQIGYTLALIEVYRVAKGDILRTSLLGDWNMMSGFKFDPRSFYARRNDLHGHVLKVLVRNNTPVSTIAEINGTLSVTGFIGHLWRLLEIKMNFKTAYLVQEDRAQGTKTKDGNWTGMIGRLLSREVDVALDTFPILSLSPSGVDISAQLLRTRYRTYIRKVKLDQRLEWDNYFVPFDSRLWNAVLWVIVLISFSLAISYRVGRLFGSEPKEGPFQYSFYDSFHYVLGAFCQQGQDVTPQSIASRIVFAICYLTAIIVLNAYSAAIISALTNDEIAVPFFDHQGLLDDGTYYLGTEKYSALHAYYSSLKKINEKGSYLYRLVDETMESNPDNFVVDKMAGLQRICSMKYAFMTLETDMPRMKKSAPCDIIPLPFKPMEVALSMALQRHSPYLGVIDYFIRRFHDAGVLKRALEVTVPQRATDKWTSVDLHSVSSMLVFLHLGMLMSITILLLEKLVAHLASRKGVVASGKSSGRNESVKSRGRVPRLGASNYRRRNFNLKKRLVYVLTRQKYD